MRILTVTLFLCLVNLSSAIKIPVRQSKRTVSPRGSASVSVSTKNASPGPSGMNVFVSKAGGTSDGLNLQTAHDLIYIANITVAGVDYPVQLDTGSSDLWIQGSSLSAQSINDTGTTFNLTYGIGWVAGRVVSAPVQFAGVSIPSQAFLDATSVQNPALQYGAVGIAGLGFTSLSSLDALLNKTGSSTGRSLLYNAFAANPSEPNFIAFSLQRSTGPTDDIQGSFTIGEYEPAFAAIANTPKIPTFPPDSPKRWNVQLDSYIVGTTTFPVSTNVTGAPSGKAIVLLDSGTSYTYVTTDVANAIYGSVNGAKFDSTIGQWRLPCSTEIDMALQIGGQVLPVHPLDVVATDPSNPTSCVGAFVPQTVAVGGNQFDWLVGDNVLRSVYSVYDFGDFDSSGKMGAPYVRLMSIIDPNQASSDFTSIRGGTPRTNITYNASNGSGSGTATVSLSEQLANSLNKIADFLPAMLAILALNALVLVIVAVIGVLYLLKRKKGGKSKKSKKGLDDMPIDLDRRAPTPIPTAQHTYEPVQEGNEPEDPPFTPPPMPIIRGLGSSPRPGILQNSERARTKSMYSTTSTTPLMEPRGYRTSGATEVTLFAPPSPAFHQGERPKSIA